MTPEVFLENFRRLNDIGQGLTQKLGSPDVLQNIVDQTRSLVEADLVVLYPYDETVEQFLFPAVVSGRLFETDHAQPDPARRNDLVTAVLSRTEPIFVEDSAELYNLPELTGVEPGIFIEREQIRSIVIIPLRIVQEILGVLFINFRQAVLFDVSKKLLTQGVANYAAIAIKNSREFGSLHQRREQELEILQKIDRDISKTLNLQEVLQTILNLTTRHIKTDKAAIFLYNPHTKILERQAVTGHDDAYDPGKAIPLDEEKGITRWVFESKRPVRVDNVRRDPHWREVYLEGASNILSELDVPLLYDDEVVGIINFESTREAAFSQADQEFLVTLAGQVVLAVRNAQAYERQKHLADEREALNKISRKIIGHLDSTRIFEFILDQALQVTNAEVGTLMLYDPQRGDLWMAAERGVSKSLKGGRHGLHEGITGWVARNKKLLNVADISKPPWNALHLPFIPGIRSELAVPLLEGNRLRGVINIESPEPHHFKTGDEQLLQEFADLSVITLRSSEGYREAKEGKARLQALHNVDREIIGQLEEPDHVMRTILKNAAILTKADRVSLHLYNEDQADDIYRAHWNDQHPPELDIKHYDAAKAKQGIVAHVAATKRFYLTRGDAQNDPYYQGDSNVHCEVAVPLLSRQNNLIGVLNLESFQLYAFDADDVDLLELFAGQAVIAIQNARAYAHSVRREGRFRLLHETAQQLGEIADLEKLEDVFDIVARIAEKHFRSQVVIRRFDPDTEELVVVHNARWQQSSPVSRVKLTDPYLGAWVARHMQTMAVSDMHSLPEDAIGLKPTDPKTQAAVSTPIKIEGKLYGILALTYEKPRNFNGNDVKLMEGLAHQLAIAIQRLEATAAQQIAEQRATTAEVMGSIGQQAFELAHRLGNDLGLVRAYVNDIREELQALETVNPTIDSNLQKIVHDVQQVLTLSGNLKQALTREIEHDPIEVPIGPLLHDAINGVSAQSALAQVHFEIKDIDEEIEIFAVPKQIAGVLHNLFTNAIESMPEGGKIILQTHKTARYVEIDVIDTGIGIAPEKQGRIFDLLFSTKNSTGFGLWSARRTVLENGGELILKESQPQQGATFTLRLLRADAQFRGAK